MLSYTNELYRLMVIIGAQEEDKLLVLKYVDGLSLYIQQSMVLYTVRMLVDAFHYANNLESKHK